MASDYYAPTPTRNGASILAGLIAEWTFKNPPLDAVLHLETKIKIILDEYKEAVSRKEAGPAGQPDEG